MFLSLIAKENIPPRGRKRAPNEKLHRKFIKKELVERGERHTTKKGRIITAKIFDPQSACNCKNDCAIHIDILRQQQIFNHYYGSSNWSNKTIFIRSNVKRTPVKHQRSEKNPIVSLKARLYNTEYSLTDWNGTRHTVCRQFFMSLLQISADRLRGALCSEFNNPNAIDRRGKAPCKSKTNLRDLQYLREFIGKFPRYESHYCRSNTNRKYLAPSLTISKMYREYEIVCEFQQKKCLSEFMFRRTFNYDFNLAFKRRKADTCKRCDELKTNARDMDVSAEIQHHDESVSRVKQIFLDDISLGLESNERIQCFTFDLQKTLETPSLSTSVAYYKRQLWTFNLCVYDEIHRIAYMYIWSENVASRGAQEIGSALLYHFKHNLPAPTDHIILYSDSCGGQNRNIKLTLMFKKFLCTTGNISSIEQKYFIPGHSYNSCDRCFGLIEKQKKQTENIFWPQHWANLIRRAKKNDPKFVVTELSEDDFFSCNPHENLIVNRKKTQNNEKINWFTIRKIVNEANDPFTIYLEIDGDSNTKSIDISKKGVSIADFMKCEMGRLPERMITKEKYDDLISLLKFIPSEYHYFYIQLRHKQDATDEDFGLASGGSEDESDDN